MEPETTTFAFCFASEILSHTHITETELCLVEKPQVTARFSKLVYQFPIRIPERRASGSRSERFVFFAGSGQVGSDGDAELGRG